MMPPEAVLGVMGEVVVLRDSADVVIKRDEVSAVLGVEPEQ